MNNVKMNLNGVIVSAEKPVITADNRSFRYGDGCFETMKAVNGQIIHAKEHFERFFSSLELLQFEKPNYLTAAYLTEHVSKLLQQNGNTKLARIRLTLFRGNGGLYDAENHFPNYIIQTWNLNESNNKLNENGLVIDVYKDARKVCDHFSHLKSNNYLSYAMAALWAKKNHLNDAILLNPYDKIADATIANVFIVQDGMIKTPSVTEGCVNGIMKNYILHCLREENIAVEETSITIDDVLNAQEIFLTNSIYGIKWVKQCGNSNYTLQTAAVLHKKFIEVLWK
ncbi:MAG: aminotransferase class IV [Chitinophagaceae bacterium]|jgi:branched-chain amino acid aminotransferase|nr:aminotransferase class IV [Chitinophagaceae bacterium]